MAQNLIAKRAFVYAGKRIMIGQIFERGYHRGDESLLKRNYMEEVEGKLPLSVRHCDNCGRDFIGDGSYESHLYLCATIDEPKTVLPPPKKVEEIGGPDGMQLKHGQPAPVPVEV